MSDSVNTKHRLYDRNRFIWRSVRDAIEGSGAVKRMNEIYLPMPAGFIEDTTSPIANAVIVSDQGYASRAEIEGFSTDQLPYKHNNPAYMSYLQRARFPEITINTLRGLIGVASRKKLEIDLPSQIAYLEDNATKKGQTLEELFTYCLSETLAEGRITLVVDINPETNQVHLIPYVTESFINWNNDPSTGETTFAIFEEKDFKYNESFEEEEITVNIVYSWKLPTENVNEEPMIIVRRFENDKLIGKEITPSLQGIFFEEIPIVTIGSIHNQNDPSPSPISGISEIAYSIYRKDADLSQSQYMTCNPMFVISGASSENGVPTSFGSTIALVLQNPDAKAFFTETDTSGLDHVKASIAELKEEASDYGATLLGPTKKAAESTETVKIRQGAQGATLVGVVNNVVQGLTDALEFAAQISGADPKSVVLDFPTDFAETSLSPQMLTALVNAWQMGGYSKESLIEKMIENGFAKGEVEDELTRIFNEEPSSSGDD